MPLPLPSVYVPTNTQNFAGFWAASAAAPRPAAIALRSIAPIHRPGRCG
jgi:hypothetical protein